MNTMLIYSLHRLNKNGPPIGGDGGGSWKRKGGEDPKKGQKENERASEHKIFIDEAAVKLAWKKMYGRTHKTFVDVV